MNTPIHFLQRLIKTLQIHSDNRKNKEKLFNKIFSPYPELQTTFKITSKKTSKST
jgi:hypothetical protein